MDKKLKIRSTALKILSHIYLNCDTILRVKGLEYASLLINDINEDDIYRAYSYLMKKKFIETQSYPSGGTIQCEITADGIDWVEECNNVI